MRKGEREGFARVVSISRLVKRQYFEPVDVGFGTAKLVPSSGFMREKWLKKVRSLEAERPMRTLTTLYRLHREIKSTWEKNPDLDHGKTSDRHLSGSTPTFRRGTYFQLPFCSDAGDGHGAGDI